MEGIRNYLVSVVAVCMITVPAMVLVRKESLQKIVKLIGGVLILLVAIRPLLHIDFSELSEQLKQFTQKYEFDASSVEENAQSQIAERVKETSQQVIEEKAVELGGLLQAEVEVSAGELPVPIHVKLTGSMSAEGVREMKEYLLTAFEIPLEEQEWNLYGSVE